MKDLLTSEDYQFANEIIQEYNKTPLNDLLALFNRIRDRISYAEENKKQLIAIRKKDISDIDDKLSHGTIVRNIIINTNKGRLVIYNYGEIYRNIFVTLKKLKAKYKDVARLDHKLFRYLSFDRSFISIYEIINKTQLGEFQKRVVTGMIQVHFKIWKDKPLMTRIEFDRSEIIGNYKRYLSDIVKSELKSISI